MPAKPITLDTRSFKTQGEAEKFFRGILRSYSPGDRISDVEARDLLALLDRHPEYPEKIGKGLSHFEVMMTEQGTPCFRIVRTDNTGTDFSFYAAIKGRPPTRKQEVLSALRRTIQSDIAEARSRLVGESGQIGGLISCAATGDHIPLSEAHVDHRPPKTFEFLVMSFLVARGLDFDRVPLTVGMDEQTAPDVTDAALVSEFQAFHRTEADLGLVKKAINLAQSSQHRLR